MFPSSNLVIISMSYMHDNQAYQTPQKRFPLLKRQQSQRRLKMFETGLKLFDTRVFVFKRCI